jgi:hypothetical protein
VFKNNLSIQNFLEFTRSPQRGVDVSTLGATRGDRVLDNEGGEDEQDSRGRTTRTMTKGMATARNLSRPRRVNWSSVPCEQFSRPYNVAQHDFIHGINSTYLLHPKSEFLKLRNSEGESYQWICPRSVIDRNRNLGIDHGFPPSWDTFLPCAEPRMGFKSTAQSRVPNLYKLYPAARREP